LLLIPEPPGVSAWISLHKELPAAAIAVMNFKFFVQGFRQRRVKGLASLERAANGRRQSFHEARCSHLETMRDVLDCELARLVGPDEIVGLSAQFTLTIHDCAPES